MEHPRIKQWEDALHRIFSELDDYLEDTYGTMYKLHPARSMRGKTANKMYDGLFNIGAAFSTGYGSRYGRGYVVSIDIVTLDKVSVEHRKKIEEDIIHRLKEKIRLRFPERAIKIDIDHNVIKIYGNLYGNL